MVSESYKYRILNFEVFRHSRRRAQRDDEESLFSVVITTPFYKPPSLALVIGDIVLISPNELVFPLGIQDALCLCDRELTIIYY